MFLLFAPPPARPSPVSPGVAVSRHVKGRASAQVAASVQALRPKLPSVEERAARGDPDAMSKLKAIELGKRTEKQMIALARGRSYVKRARLGKVARQLRSNLPLSADVPTVAKLRPFIQDRETSIEALEVLASLHSPIACDLLYDEWTRPRRPNDTSRLAGDLLHAPDVRRAASDALSALLDLRDASSCAQADKALSRLEQVGDARAIRWIGRLNYRYGCGRGKAHDCYPCLRGTNKIRDAVKAVRRRPAPRVR
jgi:hypothetical protein